MNNNGNIKPIKLFVILCVKFIIDSQNKSTQWTKIHGHAYKIEYKFQSNF